MFKLILLYLEKFISIYIGILINGLIRKWIYLVLKFYYILVLDIYIFVYLGYSVLYFLSIKFILVFWYI